MAEQSNFDFLIEHDPIFLQLASAAERAFSSDPNTTLISGDNSAEALLARIKEERASMVPAKRGRRKASA